MEILKPRYLILARHGTYDETTGELDENGRIMVSRLAEKLKKDYLLSLKLNLDYSPKLRTKQTAEIYQRILKIPKERTREEHLIRGTKDDPTILEETRIEEATRILERAISSGQAEAYLFVTHEDTAIDSTKLFFQRNFSTQKEKEIETLGFACALLIDLENSNLLIRLRP